MRRLFRPNLPENEKRRHIQEIIDRSKRRNYKKCLVEGEHDGKIVKGHLIPKSWFGKIAKDDHVYVFATHSANLNDLYSDYWDVGVPKLEHINNALVRYFTCEKHEKDFFTVDSTEPDCSAPKVLNLMAYKALIGQFWLENLMWHAYRELSAGSPSDEVFRLQKRLFLQNVIGLRHYKKQIERCLDPDSCRRCKGRSCKLVAHEVITLRGEPSVAVSGFSSGVRSVVRPLEREVGHIANWGMTVLPNDKGHVVIFHYFPDERDLIGDDFEIISRLQGRKRESAISQGILQYFENIAISPDMWEQIGKRRKSIQKMFGETMPDVGFGSSEQIRKWEDRRLGPKVPIPNPNQINLFRKTKR